MPRRKRRGCGFHGEAGQAEVEDLHLALGREHQVVRLDVAVDHALLVGVLQAQCRLPHVRVSWLQDTMHDAPVQRPRELADAILVFSESLVAQQRTKLSPARA